MKFTGLFVGIDRYQSYDINWLSCARRDAVAMHALFSDNFGDTAKLLIDGEATRSAIETQFKELEQVGEEDFVVIFFSGHGSDTHELVTYDADPNNLDTTGIPLSTLNEWLSRIPSKRIIFILDCCFSGGMGAKAFSSGLTSKDISSEDNLLKQLSGEGRIILTASLATERSWEYAKLRHGLLTYYLLDALQKAEEIRSDGKVDILSLFAYVTQRVIDAALAIGKNQNPAIRGTIDSLFKIPVLNPGRKYAAVFPDRVKPVIDDNLQSLREYGFPQSLIDSWSRIIPSLNQLQQDAINKYDLLEGQNLVVSAPTSSGKTMIGELAALKGSLDRKRCIILLPLKALVNDKKNHFDNVYGNFGLRTIIATGDSTSDEVTPLMRGQYDICLMTYEKFASIALGSPFILDQLGTIIIDEVQMITDNSRGMSLEFLLTLLKMRKEDGVSPQIIALSAVIGNTKGFERWLEARLLLHKERPVPLDEGILKQDGSFRYIPTDTNKENTLQNYVQPEYRKGSSQDYIIPLVRKLVKEGKQVIVFRETKPIAWSCALYLAESLGLSSATQVIDDLPDGDPSLASANLRKSLIGGVAFHVADLEPEERTIIESSFRAPDSQIRVIVATTTLAMGINTPTEAVVISGLMHPGQDPYSIAEYKNIVGRAGRLGYSNRGLSFLLALNPSDEAYFWNHFVVGNPEDLNSRFFADQTDPRSFILRVIVAAEKTLHKGLLAEDIISFLEKSFGAFIEKEKFPQWQWDATTLRQSLGSLFTHGLLTQDGEGKYHATEIGKLAGEAGIEVESVVRIVSALRGMTPETINDPALVAITQVTVELDETLLPINKVSTQKEPEAWLGHLRKESVPNGVITSLGRNIIKNHEQALRAKKAVACLLWVSDLPMSEIESVLTQFGQKNGAAGAIRNVRSRVCDLLPIVGRIAEILYPSLALRTRITKLIIRLETGVTTDLVDIASKCGTKLTRGDYQKLHKAGIYSIDALEQAKDEQILACINQNMSKLKMIRDGVTSFRKNEQEGKQQIITIPLYES